MTNASSFVAAGVVTVLAICLAPDSGFRLARRRASVGLAVVAGFSALSWILPSSGLFDWALFDSKSLADPSTSGFLGIVPFMISLIGLVAVALSDSISHSVSSLRRILLLLAIALVFVGSSEPLVLAACWALSPIVVWTELRSDSKYSSVSRLFAVFHVPSVILFCAAVVAFRLGDPVFLPVVALVAVGIREATIPGHSWFLKFVEEAPMGLVVAFVAPQLGVYAHIELLADTIPAETASIVAGLGALTALWASALGVVQTSARRALAYLMMSQTGLIAFGIEGTSSVAFAGSLVAWQVLAVATTGFAMTLSALEARRGRLSLGEFSGCFSRTPRMAGGFLVMGLASVGFPLTLGFVAEDLLVQGSVQQFPILSFVLIVATALNGMNVVRSFFHLFSGRRLHTGEADLTNRESGSLSAVLLILLAGGLVPSAITSREFRKPAIESKSDHVDFGRPAAPSSSVAVKVGFDSVFQARMASSWEAKESR